MTAIELGETTAGTPLTQRRTSPPRRRSRRRTFWVVTGLFLTATCLVMVSPFVWAMMSVTKPTNVAFVNPPVFTYTPTLTAFVDL